MLNLTNTTSCGRFTVRITTNLDPRKTMTVNDGVRSLIELADLLTTAAEIAKDAGVQLLKAAEDLPADTPFPEI